MNVILGGAYIPAVAPCIMLLIVSVLLHCPVSIPEEIKIFLSLSAAILSFVRLSSKSFQTWSWLICGRQILQAISLTSEPDNTYFFV